MLQAMLTAASGMKAAQDRLDLTANDIANVNTTGYRGQRVAFHDLMYQAERRGAADDIALGTGVRSRGVGVSGQGGSFQTTNRPLDVAVAGDGFIRVRRPDGSDALTRAGALQLDANGVLRSSSGDRVLGVKPVDRAGAADVTVGTDGTVAAGERRYGAISIVTVANPEGLVPLGDTLFAATGASGAPRAVGAPSLVSGVLESSNVDMGEAMVDMMEAQRAYQLASRVVSTQDDLMRIANEVKR